MRKIITLVFLLLILISLSSTAQVVTFIQGDKGYSPGDSVDILPGECDWINGYPNSVDGFYGWLRVVLAINNIEYEIGDTIRICYSALNWGGLPYTLIWHIIVSIHKDNILVWQKIPFAADTLVLSFGQGMRYEDEFDSTAALEPGQYELRVVLTSISAELSIPFVITDVIPVELVVFTATVNEGQVYLEWSTATELNNYGWEIERSLNLNSWHKIGFVKGKGNSTLTQNYSFTDYNLSGASKYYYRLKQIDFDNSYKYSAIRIINISPREFILGQNYPNPFNIQTEIPYILPRSTYVRLDVYNILGNKIVSLVDEVRPEGAHKVNFNASGLSSGVYFYVLETSDKMFKKKMMLIK